MGMTLEMNPSRVLVPELHWVFAWEEKLEEA